VASGAGGELEHQVTDAELAEIEAELGR